MSRLHPLLSLLTWPAATHPVARSLLRATAQPRALFQGTDQGRWAAPSGSKTITAAQFMKAVKNGGKVITGQDLASKKAAQEQAHLGRNRGRPATRAGGAA